MAGEWTLVCTCAAFGGSFVPVSAVRTCEYRVQCTVYSTHVHCIIFNTTMGNSIASSSSSSSSSSSTRQWSDDDERRRCADLTALANGVSLGN